MMFGLGLVEVAILTIPVAAVALIVVAIVLHVKRTADR